jgi:hypothetical protein
LQQLLVEAGCYLVRQGRHPIWYSPISDRNFPVPTNILSRHTANAVLKQAGLEKRF